MVAEPVITADALVGVDLYFQRAKDASPQAAALALNTVVGGTGLTRVRKGMYDQIAFPAGYLNADRFGKGKRASPTDLSASMVARRRATSLARFAPGVRVGSKAFSIMVKPGSVKDSGAIFPIRLRQGAILDDENFNMGLAIRLKPGDVIANKKAQPFSADRNLFLLYGPSPYQIMLDVALEQSDGILGDVETEFFRQFARLTE